MRVKILITTKYPGVTYKAGKTETVGDGLGQQLIDAKRAILVETPVKKDKA